MTLLVPTQLDYASRLDVCANGRRLKPRKNSGVSVT